VGERENILARIREALTVPAPRPHAAHGPVVNSASPALSDREIRTWLPPGGKSFEESLAIFSRNARDLKAEFELVNTADELLLRVRALMLAEKWTRIATHRGELTDLVAAKLGLPSCLTDSPTTQRSWSNVTLALLSVMRW